MSNTKKQEEKFLKPTPTGLKFPNLEGTRKARKGKEIKSKEIVISSESESESDKEEIMELTASLKRASLVEMGSKEGEDLKDIKIDEPTGKETGEILQGFVSTFDLHKDETYSFHVPPFLHSNGMTPETGGFSSFQFFGQEQLKVTPKRPSFSDSEESGDEKQTSSNLIDDELHEQFRTRNWVDFVDND